SGASAGSAKVYLAGVETPYDKSLATATGTSYTWNIAKDTAVMIESSTVFTTAGTVLLDGVEASVNATTHRASFTMGKSMNVELGAAVADVMYTVTFTGDVTLDAFETVGGDEVEATKVEGNTYYLKASDNVWVIKVNLGSSGAAVATSSNTFTSAYYTGVATTEFWTPGKEETITLTSAISGNVYVHPAVVVDFDTSANGVMFLGNQVNQTNWETFVVAPNSTYAIGSDADDLAGLIVADRDASAPETSAAAIGGTLTVGTDNIKLYGAYKLHLHDVASVKTANSNVVRDGEYVVKGTTIDADADGVNVICVNDGSYLKNATPTDIVVNSGNKDQIARAAKMTMTDGSGVKLSILDQKNNIWDEITTEAGAEVVVYVAIGTHLMVEDADSTVVITATDGTSSVPVLDVANNGKRVTFTVTAVDLTLNDA
ncbi:hypothetical protein D1646_21735, partial [Pseudoflavonifractor sp. 60]|uniref:hypothetical protein n=1 Tax=Pseudoflavonifractor sp. 60 TaxID=2304576 RepID=UPI0013683DEA